MEKFEGTTVKYTHNGDTLRNPFEHDLNINDNNISQDC
jgi:hypothetical protein